MNVNQVVTDCKLKLHRLQVIEIEDGLLLKRGRVVVKVQGAHSVEVAQALLALAADGEATREELCEPFPVPVRPAVNQLIDALVARRLLTDASRLDVSTGGEEPLDV